MAVRTFRDCVGAYKNFKLLAAVVTGIFINGHSKSLCGWDDQSGSFLGEQTIRVSMKVCAKATLVAAFCFVPHSVSVLRHHACDRGRQSLNYGDQMGQID